MSDAALTLPLPPGAAGNSRTRRSFRVLPGFGLTMGYTLVYVSLIVLIPLSAAFLRSAELGPQKFWHVVTTPRVLASLQLSFGAALLAAALNGVFGFIIAWALTRQRFPGRRLFDAIIDLPFALPTAVAGIALTALYAPNGWLGQLLLPLGILGASRFQTFIWVMLPAIWPTLLTGVALGFSRAVGEYGSVIFIAGNIPMVSEIAPLMIMTQLEQYQYAAGTAIAVVMLLASFALMFGINGLQLWAQRRRQAR